MGIKVKFQFYSFLFDKINKKFSKPYGNSTKLYEKLTNTHEKLKKNFTYHVFPPLLLVISRIDFGAQWMRPRVRKFKSEEQAINWQALGTQEILFSAFPCTGARDMTPRNFALVV